MELNCLCARLLSSRFELDRVDSASFVLTTLAHINKNLLIVPQKLITLTQFDRYNGNILYQTGNRNKQLKLQMLINKPKFSKFNSIAQGLKEDNFCDNQSFADYLPFSQTSNNCKQNRQSKRSPQSKKQQIRKPLAFDNDSQTDQASIMTQKTVGIKNSKKQNFAKAVSNIISVQNETSNENEVNELQYHNFSIQEIKKINNGVSCSDFIFCSVIPFTPNKIVREITINEVDEFADSFDILLFKNKNTLSRMQRFLTQSEYDHVAMVVKIGESRFVLEASGSTGVEISDFSLFISSYKRRLTNCSETMRYELGYRKLKPNNNEKQQELVRNKLKQFLNRVLGKKYKFSPLYILTQEYQKQEQTYFCSELIAECLKYCFNVKLGKPCYKILPRDFSQVGVKNEQQQINSSSCEFINNMYENLKKVSSKKSHNKIR